MNWSGSISFKLSYDQVRLQELYHLQVDGPLVSHRLTWIGKGGHIWCRPGFRANVEYLLSTVPGDVYDPLPPCKKTLPVLFPFWRERVIQLG
jgi:hypothetical protein